jgi:hypothetical protein
MTLEKYTGSVRGITFGVGQEDYMWGVDAPVGLGVPVPEISDSSSPRDGSYGGTDRVAKRIIRVPITIIGNQVYVDDELVSPAEHAELLLNDLKRAWRPSSDVVELDLRFAGSERRYFGRCRGLEVDLTNVHQGVVYADGTFEALEWLAYDTEVIESDEPTVSSPVIVPNPGNAATTRCVLTITGNGGTPVIVNTDDPFNGFIRFRKPLANGDVVRINLNNFNVTDPDGDVAREDMISPLSTFFVIEADEVGNTVTFTGCGSIGYRVRPAYL